MFEKIQVINFQQDCSGALSDIICFRNEQCRKNVFTMLTLTGDRLNCCDYAVIARNRFTNKVVAVCTLASRGEVYYPNSEGEPGLPTIIAIAGVDLSVRVKVLRKLIEFAKEELKLEKLYIQAYPHERQVIAKLDEMQKAFLGVTECSPPDMVIG